MRRVVALLAFAAIAAGPAFAWSVWTPIGPELNPVLCGAISSSNPQVMLIVVSKGSTTTLFRTTDRGASWATVSDSLSFRPQSILFQPGSDSIIYAVDNAVFRSSDRGHTWSRLPTPDGTIWGNLAFSGTDSNQVWLAGYTMASAGGQAAAAVSTDAGSNWTVFHCDSAMRSHCHSACLDPTHDSIVYCGGSIVGQAVIYKSTDRGLSWTRHDLPISATPDSVASCSPPPQEEPVRGRVQFLYVDPTNPDVLLAAMTWYGVFRSTDAGVTWTHYGGIHEAHSLACIPLSPEIVFVGATNGLYKTTNAGASWSGPYQPPHGGLVGCVLVPVDVSNEALAGTSTAVFRTANQGQSWDSVSLLDTIEVTALDVVQTTPRFVYAAIAGKGVFRSTDGGDGWSHCRNPSGSGSVAAIAAPDTLEAWSLADSGLCHTSDGGRSWVCLGDWFDHAGAVSVSPLAATSVVATGNRSGLAQVTPAMIPSSTDDGQAGIRPPPQPVCRFAISLTTDRGLNWNHVSLSPNGTGRAVALSPKVPGRFLVAGDSFGTAVVFTSRDSGRTWSRTGVGLTGAVHGIGFEPTVGNQIYCSTTDGAFRSSDTGNTWHQVGLSHVNAIVYWNGWLIAGTDSGVYMNQGSNWQPWSYGLVDSSVASMAVGDWNLYAGTRTAGLFRGYPPVGVDDRPTDGVSRPAYLMPTVVRNAIVLQYAPDIGRTCLMDACGRRVMTLHWGANDVRDLSPGVYFVREAQALPQAVRKIIITR